MTTARYGFARYSDLVDELNEHVRSIAQEAVNGDYEARSWLCENFPGHVRHLARFWDPNMVDRERQWEREQRAQRSRGAAAQRESRRRQLQAEREDRHEQA